MGDVRIFVDGKEIECRRGDNLLSVCLKNGIYIPHLCFMEEGEPYGGCRLCFVEIEGEDLPKCACTVSVEEGLSVRTDGERASRLRRTAFELIMSNHPVECKTCRKNNLCKLQIIARHLKVPLTTKKYEKVLKNWPIDSSSPVFDFDPNKCVQCGRCVRLAQRLDLPAISFAYRGFLRRVSAFWDEPLGTTSISTKREFIDECPVGAFVPKEKVKEEVHGNNR